jgi:hypothetical protein
LKRSKSGNHLKEIEKCDLNEFIEMCKDNGVVYLNLTLKGGRRDKSKVLNKNRSRNMDLDSNRWLEYKKK